MHACFSTGGINRNLAQQAFCRSTEESLLMRILVAGGMGFIGRALVRQLSAQGNEIVALVRDVADAAGVFPPEVMVNCWDGMTVGDWRHSLEDIDGVINLSGAPIGGGRWTPRRKALILQSRVAPHAGAGRSDASFQAPSPGTHQCICGWVLRHVRRRCCD